MMANGRIVSVVVSLLALCGASSSEAQNGGGRGFNPAIFGNGQNANPESTGPQFDGKISVEQLASMKDQPMVLHLRSGVRIEDATFGGVVTDPRSDSIRFVEYQQDRRTAKRKAEDIYRIFIQGHPNHLRYHGPTRSFHWIDEAVAEVQALARLEKGRFQQIEPTTPESLDELNEKHNKFIQEGLQKLNNPLLRVEENDYAILITDFTAAQTQAFSRMIPAVFAYMNQQFGIPANQTVLPGKAIIAFFGNRRTYSAFETVVMDNPNFGDATTFWHYGANRFVVARFNPVFDDDSIRTICMALADGYFSRIHSTAPLPEWLSVGLRSTIADAAVPPNPRARRAERTEVATELRRQGSLLGILEATQIPRDRRVFAKVLVQYLIQRDPMALSYFIADLKGGQTADDALMLNYGLSNEMFAAQFGLSMGLPGLIP